MSMFDIPVYAGADPSTEVVATMRPGDYAEVKGRSADNWMKVDLSVGSMELNLVGWIEGEMVNFNGPCDDLPIVSPWMTSQAISHDRQEETIEAKARWFQSLSLAERMDVLCFFTDLILANNPQVVEQKDAQPVAGRIRVVTEA